MDALYELNDFNKNISKYKKLVIDWANSVFVDDELTDKLQNTRAEIQRSYSRLENVIKQYAKMGYITHPYSGKKHEVFDFAFNPIDMFNVNERLDALNEVVKIVNTVIGKLEAEGESWGATTRNQKQTKQSKVFISHSGRTPALNDLRDYLYDVDIKPLIVMRKPNLDRDVDVKVEAYIDEADFVIILATGDSRDKNNKIIPAGNVLHETGLVQARPRLKGKIIYLLEEGVEFPSNIKPRGYIRFNRYNIEQKLGAIVQEIKAMGFL